MKPKYATILIKRKRDSRASISFRNTVFLTEVYLSNFKNQLFEILSTENTILEIDMRGIRLIDNSIIDALNLNSRLGRHRNSRIILINVSRELQELLNLIKIHSVLDIREIIPEKSTMKAA